MFRGVTNNVPIIDEKFCSENSNETLLFVHTTRIRRLEMENEADHQHNAHVKQKLKEPIIDFRLMTPIFY